MAKKSAKGGGTIRKKTVSRNGREYTYWEARVTTGRDPGSGKQLQRSFTGKTQKEVREKMQAAAVQINQGVYTAPQRLAVGQWLDVWAADYLNGVKPATAAIYRGNVKNHIKLALGAVRLDQLSPHAVQGFVNGLKLAPSSVRLAYKVLYMALGKAVDLGYIPRNPAAKCELPRMEQKEIHPLDDRQAAALLASAKGSELEPLVAAALFTGLRLSELLGLTWGAVDFQRETIYVNKQLARMEHRAAELFISPKNGKARTISAAPSAMAALKRQWIRQAELRLRAGPIWDNPHELVFTSALGGPMEHWRVESGFKRLTAAAGLTNVRFHDARHTYAVNAIRAGDDIKTIQSNLGHAAAAFTLDRYGHFTERMQQDSAARMEGFIKDVLGL